MIPYGRQLIDAEDIDSVVKTLKSDYLTTGPAVEKFETALKKATSAKYAIALANGTAALHLAMLALRIGKGDSVIVPSISFIATANAARFVGAEIIFSDVDSETGLMTPELLLQAIERAPKNSSIKAIIAVDLNGSCVDIVNIHSIAKSNNISLIMDSCHSIGGSYLDPDDNLENVGSCNYSIMTCFSFHPVKSIAMGEGGAITTNSEQLDSNIRLLRNHGINRNQRFFKNLDIDSHQSSAPPWYYEMIELGYNYRASDIHCALGASQLKKLNTFIKRRQAIASKYDELLLKFQPIINIPIRSHMPAWHLYAIRIDFKKIKKKREEIVKALINQGVGTQVHYIPINRQPYYEERYGKFNLTGANAYYDKVLSLPIFPLMTDKEVEYVVNKLIHVTGVNNG